MTDYERTTRGTAPDTSSDSPREERLQALFAAADPRGEPSDALVRRVAELGTQRAATPRPARRWWPRRHTTRGVSSLRELATLRVARWCVAGLVVAALISFWPVNRQDAGALAAALEASAAAPAMHVVGRGTQDTQELWYLAGVGCYLYGKNPRHETILVDDMKHYYRYEILERRVYINRSLLADPKHFTLFWETHSGAGIVKQMLQAFGEKGVSVETVRREGRALRQVVGPRRVTRVTIDPENDRILLSESDVRHPDGTVTGCVTTFEYPDPRTVDRRHFQFRMPKDVTIVDQTKEG